MVPPVIRFLTSPDFVAFGLAVVGLLVGTWWLRGSAPGQTLPVEQDPYLPATDQRERGVWLLAFGLLLIAAGAWIGIRHGVMLAIPSFAVGYLLVWRAAATSYPHRHGSPGHRRIYEVATRSMTGSLLVGILVLLNVFGFRYGGRPIDVTLAKVNSLAELSVKQARSLDRPVRFVIFSGRGEREAGQFDQVLGLLRLYREANPRRITIDELDPFTDRRRAEELGRRVPDLQLSRGGGVIVEYGSGESIDRVVVRNTDLFQIVPPMGSQAPTTIFRGEPAITSALIQLRQEVRPKVVVTTGHGEPSLREESTSTRGLAFLRARLENVGLNVEVFNPTRDLPADTAALIIAGPTTNLAEDEVARIRSYAEVGGRVVVLLDGQHPCGLEGWLESLGLRTDPRPIVDPVWSYRRQPNLPLAQVVGDSSHPIVASLRNQAILMPGPAVIQGFPASNPRLVATPILRTSPDSWAESDPANATLAPSLPRDQLGPLVVGVAIAERLADRTLAPRAVVLSSRVAFDNEVVVANDANLEFAANAVTWLLDRSDISGLAPRTREVQQLTADPNLRAKLVLLPTVFALALLIGLGTWAYVSRRS